MAVAIRLARDVSKAAPDLLDPIQFRKGQIVRIEGPIHRPRDINSWGKPYENWSSAETAGVSRRQNAILEEEERK